MAFKRALDMRDSGIAESKLEVLKKLTEGNHAERPLGLTAFAEDQEGNGRRVIVDDDGFMAMGPQDFREAHRVPPTEYAEIKRRQVSYSDLQLENVDIVAELSKL